METEFSSLNELYNRLKPALYSKVIEYRRNSINYIKEVDIFNYLSITKWKNGNSLLLADLVDDIMSLNSEDIKAYVHDILKSQDRNIENVGDSLL